jgi:hypothetical protein
VINNGDLPMQPPSDWLTPALLTYLLNRVGSWVKRAEIDLCLGTHDWSAALAELIDDEGYRILTARADRCAAPSHVNLIDQVPATEFPDCMDYSLRHRLAKQGKLFCKICARAAGDPHPYWIPGKIRLHARFKVLPENGRGQTRDNVEALCSVCRDSPSLLQNAKPSLAELKKLFDRADDVVRQELRDWLLESISRAEAAR